MLYCFCHPNELKYALIFMNSLFQTMRIQELEGFNLHVFVVCALSKLENKHYQRVHKSHYHLPFVGNRMHLP